MISGVIAGVFSDRLLVVTDKKEAAKAAKRAELEAKKQAEKEQQKLTRKREREEAAAAKKLEAKVAKRKKNAPPEREGYGVSWSEEHGHWYWWNRETHASSWTDPAPEQAKPRKKRQKKEKAAAPAAAAEDPAEAEGEDGPDEDEEEEEWLTTGHRWIGLKGMRYFNEGDEGFVFGSIVSWLPARASVTHEPDDYALWRFQHADGDLEDLEEHEVRESVAELRAHEAREAAPQRSAEENWKDFVQLRDSSRAKAAAAASEGGQRWQCKKGDKLLCFDRNKSTASAVEVANCYEAVILRVRPISKPAPADRSIKVTKSPPDERSASPVVTSSEDAVASTDIETTAADVEDKKKQPTEAAVAQEDEEEDGQEYFLHFLGYSKGQDRWERESNFVPLHEEARKLKERMHNQWDRKKSAHSAAAVCPLPGDPENVHVGYGAVRYAATVPDVVPECLNGILPPAPLPLVCDAAANGSAAGDAAAAAASDSGAVAAEPAAAATTVVDTAAMHLRQFGCTTLPTGLGEEDVSACATVIEQWFNHVGKHARNPPVACDG